MEKDLAKWERETQTMEKTAGFSNTQAKNMKKSRALGTRRSLESKLDNLTLENNDKNDFKWQPSEKTFNFNFSISEDI